MKEIAGKNANMLLFNIDLYKQLANSNQELVNEPKIDISIRLRVPDNMINNQSYTIRNYKVLRMHTDTATKQDTIDVLDVAFNSNTKEITFETDKFSVYALTYKDTYYSPSYPVTGIKVSPDTLTLTKKDESAQLTAEVTPSYADNKRVTWKSSDEKVATVDENGKVTAVANGTATITITTEDGKHTASVTITVNIPDEPMISNTTGFGRLKARSTKQTKTSVTLEWSRIDDADGYFIYGNRCNTSTKSYKYKKLATITNGNTRTWTQKDLQKGTYYKYVVKAYKIVNGKKVVTDTSASIHTETSATKAATQK